MILTIGLSTQASLLRAHEFLRINPTSFVHSVHDFSYGNIYKAAFKIFFLLVHKCLCYKVFMIFASLKFALVLGATG